MLVENYSNSRSLQTQSAAKAIFSDLRVNTFTTHIGSTLCAARASDDARGMRRHRLRGRRKFEATLVIQSVAAGRGPATVASTALIS